MGGAGAPRCRGRSESPSTKETGRDVQKSRRLGSTHLPTPENMVPNGSASEVDVEVSETAFHAHQTVPAAQKRGMGRAGKIIQVLNHWRCLTCCPFINANTGDFSFLFKPNSNRSSP